MRNDPSLNLPISPWVKWVRFFFLDDFWRFSEKTWWCFYASASFTAFSLLKSNVQGLKAQQSTKTFPAKGAIQPDFFISTSSGFPDILLVPCYTPCYREVLHKNTTQWHSTTQWQSTTQWHSKVLSPLLSIWSQVQYHINSFISLLVYDIKVYSLCISLKKPLNEILCCVWNVLKIFLWKFYSSKGHIVTCFLFVISSKWRQPSQPNCKRRESNLKRVRMILLNLHNLMLKMA